VTARDVAVRRISEMEGAFGGGLKRARAELGVSSFGLAVIELGPDETRFPEHDHRGDRQEEVYLLLRGAAVIELDGGEERVELDDETFVRVGPLVRRKVLSGPEGARVLVIGATPGEVYDAPDFSKLGQLPLSGGRREGY
jgi:mannose-6-phosphate isomerase-like protein (cupin superfamily)